MLQFYFSGDFAFLICTYLHFYSFLQKFLIRHIHAECAKRGGDDDGHDCYGEDDLAAAKACCQGDGANGGLDGCFWQVGEYAEKSFFRIEVCFYPCIEGLHRHEK